MSVYRLLHLPFFVALLAIVPFFVTPPCFASFAPRNITQVQSYQKLRSHANSTLYTVALADTEAYDKPFYLIDLHGNSRYDIGYAYGNFLAVDGIICVIHIARVKTHTHTHTAEVSRF